MQTTDPFTEKPSKVEEVKCNCPCHNNIQMKHVVPCCIGGYIKIYKPIDNVNKIQNDINREGGDII